MKDVTFDSSIEPFSEKDDEGFGGDFNKITVEIKVGGQVVWSKTATTNDFIESVYGLREELFAEALKLAQKEYGYEPDEEDFEAAGYIVTQVS